MGTGLIAGQGLVAGLSGVRVECSEGMQEPDHPKPRDTGERTAGFVRGVLRTPAGRRTARTLGLAAALAGLGALVYVSFTTVGPLVGEWFVRAVAWLVRGSVWLVLAVADGADSWSLLTQLGGAALRVVDTPQVTAALVLLQLLGAGAFYVLNRIIAGERRVKERSE